MDATIVKDFELQMSEMILWDFSKTNRILCHGHRLWPVDRLHMVTKKLFHLHNNLVVHEAKQDGNNHSLQKENVTLNLPLISGFRVSEFRNPNLKWDCHSRYYFNSHSCGAVIVRFECGQEIVQAKKGHQDTFKGKRGFITGLCLHSFLRL
jgi:hypothetical protein